MKKISVVCHENIARSQVLHRYIDEHAQRTGLDIEVFSCGTGASQTFPDVEERLREVENRLRERGLDAKVARDWWNENSKRELVSSDAILVAEEARRKDVLERLGDAFPADCVFLFYEFIGEGQNDFVDTYDPDAGRQDPERFDRCFDELERIARGVVARLNEDTRPIS